VTQHPKSDLGSLVLEVSRSHTITDTHTHTHTHTKRDSSEGGAASRRARYPNNTKQTQDRNIISRTRDSNSRSQHSSGRKW